MKIATPALLLALGTSLLTFSVLALILSPPLRLDSRDILVLAEGLAGIAFAALAARRLVGIHRALKAH